MLKSDLTNLTDNNKGLISISQDNGRITISHLIYLKKITNNKTVVTEFTVELKF